MSKSPIQLKEKIGYALGDGAANIAWRGVSTFLFVFYTDVYGLDAVSVGLIMLVARSFDGVSDVAMGIIGDSYTSKYGKFRPWILWTAIPLAISLSLLYTTPDFSDGGKLVYAYITYILFTLIYTANNIPYGALMSVMTGDQKERISLGSFRMGGAFMGGLLVQGSLLYLVLFFGNVSPEISVQPSSSQNHHYVVDVRVPNSVDAARISINDGVGIISTNLLEQVPLESKPSLGFSASSDSVYRFYVYGIADLSADQLSVINQKTGYRNSIYLLSLFLAVFMILTYFLTKERVLPPKSQNIDIKADLIQLIKNKPWVILLLIGFVFNVYSSIKQGITVLYFTHFLHQEIAASTYMISLMIASIAGVAIATPLGRRFGKKNLFISSLILSGLFSIPILFFKPDDIEAIFVFGCISEFFSAMFPTLLFVMLGDAADYSEWKNGRRATGLIYSAGSLATKFGGGVAGAVIGFVLAAFNYIGTDPASIEGARTGMIWLMSWIPAVVALLGAIVMVFYPLSTQLMETIQIDLEKRRNEIESSI